VKMEQIGCPETPVKNYQSTLHKIPEEWWQCSNKSLMTICENQPMCEN
jgi:hypothetical protein